jgi:MYXO-CTERM domain-containing protein
VSGEQAVSFSYRYPSAPFNTESTTTMYWTDQTRFNIVPAPVPEPEPAAMAAAGLLLLAALRRRYSPVPIRRR